MWWEYYPIIAASICGLVIIIVITVSVRDSLHRAAEEEREQRRRDREAERQSLNDFEHVLYGGNPYAYTGGRPRWGFHSYEGDLDLQALVNRLYNDTYTRQQQEMERQMEEERVEKKKVSSFAQAMDKMDKKK